MQIISKDRRVVCQTMVHYPEDVIKEIKKAGYRVKEVRMYGNNKYGDPDNWKSVDIGRYIDALLRHTLAFVDNMDSVDAESGIPHYQHMACNMAFICEMMRWRSEQIDSGRN